MHALKARRKISRSQSHTGGSSEGASVTPEVLDESTCIFTTSSEGTGIKPGVHDEVKINEEIEWLSTDEEEKKQDDDDDDRSIDLAEIDDKDEDDEYIHDEDYVHNDVDEEMKDAEVSIIGKDDN
ncbi:hypothetical protein Tco_0008133 [Tanacetum coccineum]